MSRQFAAGKKALGLCDRCGRAYKLSKLKKLTINETRTNLKVCSVCFEPDHPQYQVGRIRVVDPQAIKDARPDTAELDVGRSQQYGWNPVGLSDLYDLDYPNEFEVSSGIGSVTATGS